MKDKIMKRILTVDDKEENLYLLRVLLEGHGYKVEQAVNGSEALVKARTDRYDLVITDILMPVMDGFALCRALKADDHLKHIPLVFYTATYTDERDKKLALDMGVSAFIIKPAEPDEFMRRIEEILAANKKGKISMPQIQQAENEVILKEYNEALIRKLEQKTFRLEEANKALEAEIAAKKQAESQGEALLEKIKKLNEELEQRVAQRTAELLAKTAELERINKVFVDRELRMRELKEQIAKLEGKYCKDEKHD